MEQGAWSVLTGVQNDHMTLFLRVPDPLLRKKPGVHNPEEPEPKRGWLIREIPNYKLQIKRSPSHEKGVSHLIFPQRDSVIVIEEFLMRGGNHFL
jgi:hypothetical protein